MYDRAIVEEKLNQAEQRNGWRPVPHPVSYIIQATDHIASLEDPDTGALKRPLTPDEVRFIENERLMSRISFRYYATRYAVIQHFEGGERRFIPNVAQQATLKLWARLEALGRSVSVQILKARQLGMSTISEIALAHRIQTTPQSWAIVGSSNPVRSEAMVKMMARVWQNMPWWMMPGETRVKTGELIEFPTMRSGVTIAHGAAMSGIGRGSTLQAYHLSELAEFHNAEELVDAALNRATHESPYLLRLMESTASGKNNWWHRTWKWNKDNFWAGRASFCPQFLPWYIGLDLYPTKTWIMARPVPADWHPSRLTIAHAERAKRHVAGSTMLQDILGVGWEMPIEQMWYWEIDRAEYEAKGDLAKFHQEMPADDYEAFQSSGQSIFATTLIQEVREQASTPIGIYGVAGDANEIPLSRQPAKTEIRPEKRPIEIVARWNPSKPAHNYTLHSLKMDDYPNIGFDNKLVVWEFPKKDEIYGIGVDTGFGIGQDSTVVTVIRRGDYWTHDRQVAEFASRYLGALDLWPILMAIGTLYSVPVNGTLKQPKMVIEAAANGETAGFEMRKRGWNHFHIHERYDSKKMDSSRAPKLHWMTNSWSRPMMLDYFISAIRDGWMDVNSPELIEEMSHFHLDPLKNKIMAENGAHDDRLMALGIVLFSLHIRDTRSVRRVRANKNEDDMTPDPLYDPGYQAKDIRAGVRSNPFAASHGLQAVGGHVLDGLQSKQQVWYPNDEDGSYESGDYTINW